MNCFGGLSNIFASEGSPIYLPNLGSKFSRTKSFCFENYDFTCIWLRHVSGSRLGLETWDWACRHSGRIMYLLECDCLP